MSRIKNAWRALRGVLPAAIVEEVEVGAPEPVTVYRIELQPYAPYDGAEWKKKGICHLSCAAAFADIENCKWLRVDAVRAIRIGRKYYQESSPLKMFKPKIPKGKHDGQ